MTLRKRLFAWFYHNVLSNNGIPDLDDAFTRDIRAPLLSRASGDVLEIGAGNGGNLLLYPGDVTLTLLEPNPYMVRYLHEASLRPDTPACEEIIEGYGEILPFTDNRFDTVVMTHVLCSVKDQAKVLGEVRRVLRDGGQFLFLEHVAASAGTRANKTQNLINPLWKQVGDGCNITRDTAAVINSAGFASVELEAFSAESFPRIVSPHICGVATA